jgi:hypothetical protein
LFVSAKIQRPNRFNCELEIEVSDISRSRAKKSTTLHLINDRSAVNSSTLVCSLTKP